jgi:hypothetical protein
VVTLTEQDAVDMLKKDKFRVEKLYEYSDTVEKGIVISQTPEYPEKIKAGSVVTIVISNGPENVEVPSLSEMQGLSLEDVAMMLEELGFKVNAITEYSDNYAEGTVIDVANAGESAAYGSTIDVTVSMGKAPTITYEVTFDFAAKKPDDAVVRYDYTLTIDGKVEKWYEVSDFEPIYVSKDKIESASIYVIWYKEDASQPGGYKVVGEKDYTLEIVKIVETSDDATTDENSQQDEEQQEE